MLIRKMSVCGYQQNCMGVDSHKFENCTTPSITEKRLKLLIRDAQPLSWRRGSNRNLVRHLLRRGGLQPLFREYITTSRRSRDGCERQGGVRGQSTPHKAETERVLAAQFLVDGERERLHVCACVCVCVCVCGIGRQRCPLINAAALHPASHRRIRNVTPCAGQHGVVCGPW
jgi:hypothetical protein